MDTLIETMDRDTGIAVAEAPELVVPSVSKLEKPKLVVVRGKLKEKGHPREDLFLDLFDVVELRDVPKNDDRWYEQTGDMACLYNRPFVESGEIGYSGHRCAREYARELFNKAPEGIEFVLFNYTQGKNGNHEVTGSAFAWYYPFMELDVEDFNNLGDTHYVRGMGFAHFK